MGGSDFTRVLKKSDFSKIRDFPPPWLMGTLLWPILAHGRPGELQQADFLLRASFPAGIAAQLVRSTPQHHYPCPRAVRCRGTTFGALYGRIWVIPRESFSIWHINDLNICRLIRCFKFILFRNRNIELTSPKLP